MKYLDLILCVICAIMLPAAQSRAADSSGELILAEKGMSAYQIIIPDHAADSVTDHWLLATGKLMEAAFQKNGFTVPVVHESAKDPNKPGIYLGATKFAQQSGIHTDKLGPWAYIMKAVGPNLMIVGEDHKDKFNMYGTKDTPLALLGSVKGACDFLREYAGVRFLFRNTTVSPYHTRGDGLPVFNKDGSLNIDTRSIAFTPIKRIAVPVALNLQKAPMMIACMDGQNIETFYTIANNFFPILRLIRGGTVRWGNVIPLNKYGKSHPEYFALLPNGKRASDPSLTPGQSNVQVYSPTVMEAPLDITNPDVQDLMVQAIEEKIKNGDDPVTIFPMDGYRLVRCNCDRCNQLFGMPAKTPADILARNESGKAWKVIFSIVNRVREKYPDAKIICWSYHSTPIGTGYIQKVRKFPDNLQVMVHYGTQEALDELEGIQVPAGVAGIEATFTGFWLAGSFTPERTPAYAARIVKAQARNQVRWSLQDGGMRHMPISQAPAYYVYGRMKDDPTADWESINNEFMTAAFGEAANEMTEYFHLQNEQIAIYSDMLGYYSWQWWGKRKNINYVPYKDYTASQFHGNDWYFKQIYTLDYLAQAGKLLAKAAQKARDPDVKARINAVRITYNYFNGLSRALHLQSAWEIHPTQESLQTVLDAVDAWHTQLKDVVDKPLVDWPEMYPFGGYPYSAVALQEGTYRQTMWLGLCINWDTAAIRDGILTKPHRIKVPAVTGVPGINSEIWSDAPTVKLRTVHQVMSAANMPRIGDMTTLKVVHDRDNLYIRIDAKWPLIDPENQLKPKSEKEVFKQYFAELGIRPKAHGPIYHLAVTPTKGDRYDAVLTPDAKGKMTEDVSWNGQWEYVYEVSGKPHMRYGERVRTWTAWFKIPFSSLGVQMPAAGDTWSLNAGRGRYPQYMVWKEGVIKSITDPQAMGKLEF